MRLFKLLCLFCLLLLLCDGALAKNMDHTPDITEVNTWDTTQIFTATCESEPDKDGKLVLKVDQVFSGEAKGTLEITLKQIIFSGGNEGQEMGPPTLIKGNLFILFKKAANPYYVVLPVSYDWAPEYLPAITAISAFRAKKRCSGTDVAALLNSRSAQALRYFINWFSTTKDKITAPEPAAAALKALRDSETEEIRVRLLAADALNKMDPVNEASSALPWAKKLFMHFSTLQQAPPIPKYQATVETQVGEFLANLKIFKQDEKLLYFVKLAQQEDLPARFRLVCLSLLNSDNAFYDAEHAADNATTVLNLDRQLLKDDAVDFKVAVAHEFQSVFFKMRSAQKLNFVTVVVQELEAAKAKALNENDKMQFDWIIQDIKQQARRDDMGQPIPGK